MTPEEKYEYYLTNNNAGERIVEVVEISHSSFEAPFYLVREPFGLTVTLENDEQVFCEGVNMQIRRSSSENNLDEKFGFDFDDTENRIQDEAEKIPLESTEKVKVIYRLYMYSDLTSISLGPISLEAVSLTITFEAVSIEAQSPTLVETRTGSLYSYERFPALKAFLS